MSDAPEKTALTYSDAGVDREAAAGAKLRIRELVRSTFNSRVIGDIGSFGGGFRMPVGASDTLLVASADGVGTKLKIAVMAGSHEGVGYDIVAHCADDILTQVISAAGPEAFGETAGRMRGKQEALRSKLRGIPAIL